MPATRNTTSSTRRVKRAPDRPHFQAPEPLIDHPAQVEAVTGRRAPKKAAPAKATKAARPASKPVEPKPAEPERAPSRPSQHNGVEVVREELHSNLPSGAPYKVSKLHLVDGTIAHACRDCLFTADTSPEVRRHRNDAHGSRYGKRPPKVQWPKDPNLGDLVLPPRGEVPAPTNPMEMTLGEYLSLCPSISALSDLIDRTERERDAALAQLAELKASSREAQHAINVYPALQQEVVELRLMVRDAGTFEELKAEVLSLRAFKKKTLAKFGSMGFSYVEEDSKEN